MEVQSGRFTQSSTKNFLDAHAMPNSRKQTRSSLALLLDQDVVHNVDQATTYRPDSSIVAAYTLFLVYYTRVCMLQDVSKILNTRTRKSLV